jgi:membrane protease YdiL (CAAX protease family)
MMKKYLISFLLATGGLGVFVFGSPYYSVFDTNRNQLYLIIVSAVLLVTALVIKGSASFNKYWSMPYALFIASCATIFLNTGILNIPYNGSNDLIDLALDKFGQFSHIVPVILILTFMKKDSLSKIYIAKGNVKQGLKFGVTSFVIFAVLFFIQIGLSAPTMLRPDSLLYVCIFIFANAFMEELWFRGIFLKHYSPHIGKFASIFITSFIFGTSHINATYDFPGGAYIYGTVVFILGYIGADSMMKTDSVIGPVLFHAGYDLMIILSVINSM